MEEKKYTCPQCDKLFKRKSNRDIHVLKIHTNIMKPKPKESYQCPECTAVFTRKPNRDRHVTRVHRNVNLVHECSLCGIVFDNVFKLKEHRNSHEASTEFVELESAFKRNCIVYRKIYDQKMKTLEQSFANDVADMQTLLELEIVKKKTIKASIIFHAEFLRPLDHDLSNLQPYVVCLRSSARQLTSKEDISHFVQVARATAQERIDDFISHGSGWILDEIICTDIQLGACPPLNGSCSLLSIKYIRSLKKIKLTSEIHKNQCFYEAVAFHFTQKKKSTILDQFIKKNMNKISPAENQPVNVKDIPKFEKMNQDLDCSINILYAEDGDIYPVYTSKNVKAKHNINLLLYKFVVEEQIVDHYLYIEDITIFLRREYRGEGSGKLSYERSERCPNCLQKFSTKKVLADHRVLCMNNKPQAVNVPVRGKPEATLQFINFNRKFPAPFIGFFDFEASQKKPEFACEKCLDEPCLHKTVVETIQEPITYSFLIIETATNEVIYNKTYTGNDCAGHLISHLFSIEEELLAKMTRFPKYKFTQRDRRNIANATVCHICEKKFFDGEEKVGDHCHTTGVLFGAAHNTCNLNRIAKNKIPMFCHNLQGYDSHFIIQSLKKVKRLEEVTGLAYNSERFRTMTINSFVFLDSLSFLSGSLSELVNDLAQNKDHKFDILDQLNLYEKTEKEKKKLLIRKGVYPYESVTGIEMLIKTTELPSRADFYSKLTDSTVSVQDYRHAQKVFRKFKCTNLLQYTELYCATDVGLLAEVMMQFRSVVLSAFGVDCCHYVSTPQMAFEAMLKMTKVEIELLTDIDQVLFVEQNIRGNNSKL